MKWLSKRGTKDLQTNHKPEPVISWNGLIHSIENRHQKDKPENLDLPNVRVPVIQVTASVRVYQITRKDFKRGQKYS